jgi:hypothetical protein
MNESEYQEIGKPCWVRGAGRVPCENVIVTGNWKIKKQAISVEKKTEKLARYIWRSKGDRLGEKITVKRYVEQKKAEVMKE